jgi:hypothetical protein
MRTIAYTILVLPVAALVTTASVATAAPPGDLLARIHGVAVFSTVSRAQTRADVCPRGTAALTPAKVRQAAVVVAAAMPSFYRHAKRQSRPPIDAHDAQAIGLPATSAHSGLDFRRFCGPATWSHSVFVAVRLPHVHQSASLSAPSFIVAKNSAGWVIWAEVH